MRRSSYILICLLITCGTFAQQKINIHFEHYANGKQIIPVDSSYTNNFGEIYSISKLKYYVSNICFITDRNIPTKPSVYLVDASRQNNFSLDLPKGKITGIEFLLGVDSILNCSGAQEGVLDPLNDMFWTWNNGYVMFKLEGNSPSSSAVDNRLEYHIGGYKGIHRTMRKVRLPLTQLPAKSFAREINVCLNLDKYWTGKNNITISKLSVITLPGAEAAAIADNFVGMFTINSIYCYSL